MQVFKIMLNNIGRVKMLYLVFIKFLLYVVEDMFVYWVMNMLN